MEPPGEGAEVPRRDSARVGERKLLRRAASSWGCHESGPLRTKPEAVEFVKSFFREHKPVAAICHGPWLLAEADVIRGRKMTSWPSLKTDLRNAGANWVDEPVVTDRGLVTSRKPDDLPMFNSKMIEEFSEGVHARQRRGISPRRIHPVGT